MSPSAALAIAGGSLLGCAALLVYLVWSVARRSVELGELRYSGKLEIARLELSAATTRAERERREHAETLEWLEELDAQLRLAHLDPVTRERVLLARNAGRGRRAAWAAEAAAGSVAEDSDVGAGVEADPGGGTGGLA